MISLSYFSIVLWISTYASFTDLPTDLIILLTDKTWLNPTWRQTEIRHRPTWPFDQTQKMTQMCGASVASPHPAQTTCAFPESSDSSLLITPTSAWEKLKPRSVGCPAVSPISGPSVPGYYCIPGVAFVPACHPFLDCSGLGFVLRIFPPVMNLQSALPLSCS